MLRDGERTVGELMAALGLRQNTVSQHLAYLRRVGAVAGERRGTFVAYRVALPGLLEASLPCARPSPTAWQCPAGRGRCPGARALDEAPTPLPLTASSRRRRAAAQAAARWRRLDGLAPPGRATPPPPPASASRLPPPASRLPPPASRLPPNRRRHHPSAARERGDARQTGRATGGAARPSLRPPHTPRHTPGPVMWHVPAGRCPAVDRRRSAA